ncbi:hypothetical protein IAQ61_008126 [Plenodomus lingam]|uniref:uncharacterized protein n=1 Tax=Leptosphaeria maculans TaxID=5022 RepID=UPI003317ECD2|nr:hypothetical protein IAQ61_008126 [Plenodomus lingam]
MPTPRPLLPLLTRLTTTRPQHTHPFTTTPHPHARPLPPRRPIPSSEITENFLKGSGPGGQKINKTSSAVQLIHHPTGIVVKYQDTRSRELNRKRARRILQDRLEELELGEGARTRVKARERARKKRSAGKKKRRKYRALEGGREGMDGEEEEEGEEGEEGEEAEEGEEEKEDKHWEEEENNPKDINVADQPITQQPNHNHTSSLETPLPTQPNPSSKNSTRRKSGR